MLRYVRIPSAVEEGESLDYIEYVGTYPSRQVRVVFSDSTSDSNSIAFMHNSSYNVHLLTDAQLDYKVADDIELISEQIFDEIWIQSFDYLQFNPPREPMTQYR
ncbi:hypothetical protein GCM10008949_52230 [Deinococcus humi]|nr:hypothetical protein GCM10008949_52230 [Deinococcus humi]